MDSLKKIIVNDIEIDFSSDNAHDWCVRCKGESVDNVVAIEVKGEIGEAPIKKATVVDVHNKDKEFIKMLRDNGFDLKIKIVGHM